LYAKTPLVFVVNKSSSVNSISLNEIIDFYNGNNYYWPDGERCRPVLRPLHDSETIKLKKLLPELAPAIDKILGVKGINITQTSQENANVIDIIPGSFGYTTLSLILSEKRTLKVLRFNDIEANLRNLHNGLYPLYKELQIVIKAEKQETRDKFIAYIFSQKGQQILRQLGNQSFSR